MEGDTLAANIIPGATTMTDHERDREFWMLVRQGLLLIVDAIERLLIVEPRTAELRKERKAQG